MVDSPYDQREGWEDPQEATRAAIEDARSDIWTAVPMIIKKHDTDKNTIHGDVAVKLKHVKADGTSEWKQIPTIQDIPIQYPGGGGTTITMPMKEGDEVLYVVTSRSFDKWFNEGGVQQQEHARMHHISDGFALVGFRSKPRRLKNVSKTTWQLRTDDENPDHYIDFDPINKKTKIVSPNPVRIEADLYVTGKIESVGEQIAKVGSDNIHQTTHTHNSVMTGGDHTNKPDQGS